MSAAGIATAPPRKVLNQSPWAKSRRKLLRDKAGMLGMAVVAVYLVTALGVWFGLWGQDWSALTGGKWDGMSAEHWFGTNVLGQDIFQR